MKRVPFAIYRSTSEIDRQVKEKQSMADALPPGDTRQKLLNEIARLKNYSADKAVEGTPSTR
jgi:hypothetical protein